MKPVILFIAEFTSEDQSPSLLRLQPARSNERPQHDINPDAAASIPQE